MRALILKENGLLVLEDMELEPQTNGDEAVVQVVYAGICSSDLPRAFENGSYYYPAVLGHEIIGKFDGGLVAIYPLVPCLICEACQASKFNLCGNYGYIGSRRHGGFAQQVSVPKQNIIPLPKNFNSPVTALTEPAAVLFHALHQASLEKSHRIVIIGDGSMGLILTKILKFLGFQNVWLMGKYGHKLAMARQFGAEIIDRTAPDAMQKFHNFFDCAFELAGTEEAYRDAITALRPQGQLIFAGNIKKDFNLAKKLFSVILRKELKLAGSWNSLHSDWQEAIAFLSQNPELEKIISHTFSLEEGAEKMRDLHQKKLTDYIKAIFKI